MKNNNLRPWARRLCTRHRKPLLVLIAASTLPLFLILCGPAGLIDGIVEGFSSWLREFREIKAIEVAE